MVECDQQATATKKPEPGPPLTTEQESIVGDQTTSAARGLRYQRRSNEARILVSCLQERGYKVVPRVAY
jgi:hypothetical protein